MAAPSTKIERYGSYWDAGTTDVQIEMAAIRKGGKWVLRGHECGEGLFHHYRQLQSHLWPEDDHHRWSDLGLRAIVENDVSVFMGAGDTSKTYTMSRFVLADWWTFSENSLWLVSSTELRGAELRIWGVIKQLFNRARERYPWLPGQVLESLHCITTEIISEDQSEARLLTKGIMFLPCKRGGTFIGMGCFPAGQMVDCPGGQVAIEKLSAGDPVWGLLGLDRIKHCSTRIAPRLSRLYLSDGGVIDCTPEHPILTEPGLVWVDAMDTPGLFVVRMGRMSARVVRAEFLETDGDPRYDKSSGGYRVFNLEIEKHPSYSVGGVIVHNSLTGFKPVRGGRFGHAGDEIAAMPRVFLDAYSNWYGKANFKGIMSGNPYDLDDTLCVAAEPYDGWGSWKDNEKTQTWRGKFYNAMVVAFDGRDSPNLDFPDEKKPRYPYLIGIKKLNAVERTHGKNSWQWQSQCVGKPTPGMQNRRVLTRQLCEQFHAFDDVIWEGDATTKVSYCDAAYGGIGGDRCVAGYLEFGQEVGGRTVICCHPPVIVPVSIRNPEIPEDQIAKFIKDYCEGYDIPPQNFFFDGRGALAIALARVWSSAVNVVDFGGPATKRIVSQDEFVWDGDSKTRRLKLCSEHYSKFVTELWWTVRYVVESNQMRHLPQEAAEEFYRREWRMTNGGRIELETKQEMKERTQQSPDYADAVATGVEGARRLGFQIARLGSVTSTEKYDDWLWKAEERHRKWMKQRELIYT